MEKFMYKLIPAGVFVHIILFFGVMDIYFKSPIQHGLNQYKSLDEPPASRVLVIVADGLRAESLYKEEYEKRTPYLTNLRKNRAAWGISHTRVPTESRPGHVAIMAGIYEDPSAIMKGWKYNPVEFDSVINQSANSWCFGSPDNIYLFNKGNSSHIHEYTYSAEMQDFGKQATHSLDEWVFREIEILFGNHTLSKCGSLCDTGNVFFLNLLGLDTAGHSYKPNSKEHIYNMQIVDEGVESLELLFELFFNDNKTAYIFTADHGMTDWGSHGDGSSFETETPFIAWGAGINYINKQNDINQADIAPLIATLIGINYPINSIGVLPYQYLGIDTDKVAEAMFKNVKQLSELYKRAEQKASTAFLYKPSIYSNLDHLLNDLESNFQKKHFNAVIMDSGNIMKAILNGLDYLRGYSSKPIFICLSFGMVFWIVYLVMSIAQRDHRPLNYVYETNQYQFYIKASIFIMTFLFCYLFFESPMNWTNYLYISFPITILLLIFNDIIHLIHVQKILTQRNIVRNVKYMVTALIILEIFVFGFHYRYFFSLFAIILAFWPFTLDQSEIDNSDKYRWMFACFSLAIFPALPVMRTTFNFYTFAITVAIWKCIMLSLFTLENVAPQTNVNMVVFALLSRNQCVSYIIASGNVLFIALCFAFEKPVPHTCNMISWCLMVVLLINLFLSPTYIIFRLVNITMSLMSIYTFFLFNIEGPFMLCLLYVCYLWIKAETYLRKGSRGLRLLFRLRFNRPLTVNPGDRYIIHDFRGALFYLGLVLISFFGTGNIASLNSFDPMWVRNFLTVFSPFTMMILIVIKITIPILIITCTFNSINILSDVQISKVFSMVLLFCDIMLFNFLFLIKNTGSWLEIGTSFSHFIIMDIISIILMLFYCLSYVFTTFSLHEHYIRYMERHHL